VPAVRRFRPTPYVNVAELVCRSGRRSGSLGFRFSMRLRGVSAGHRLKGEHSRQDSTCSRPFASGGPGGERIASMSASSCAFGEYEVIRRAMMAVQRPQRAGYACYGVRNPLHPTGVKADLALSSNVGPSRSGTAGTRPSPDQSPKRLPRADRADDGRSDEMVIRTTAEVGVRCRAAKCPSGFERGRLRHSEHLPWGSTEDFGQRRAGDEQVTAGRRAKWYGGAGYIRMRWACLRRALRGEYVKTKGAHASAWGRANVAEGDHLHLLQGVRPPGLPTRGRV